MDAEGDEKVWNRLAYAVGLLWVAVPKVRGFLREDPPCGLRHLEGESSWRQTRRVSGQAVDTWV